MDLLKHLSSPISPTFSEAIRIYTRAGSWIFISGQVGVQLPPEKGSDTFEQEVRTTFERIRFALQTRRQHEPCCQHQDLSDRPRSLRCVLTHPRRFFPKEPPTSTAVQVAGLLLNARIEIDAVAFLPRRPAA